MTPLHIAMRQIAHRRTTARIWLRMGERHHTTRAAMPANNNGPDLYGDWGVVEV